MPIPEGAKPLGDGVYAVGDELHVDAVELCRSLGVPPTPENQDTAVRAALAVAQEKGIPEVEVRDEGRLN